MESGACPRGAKVYIWRAGDTVDIVAERLSLPAEWIPAAFGRVPPDEIGPGYALCIVGPEAGGVLSCPNGGLYTVRAGDSVASVALSLGVTVFALMDANPYVDPEALAVGQVICVPGGVES